ncbi:ATP-binding protein [Alkalicoccus urumqiensis]|uniref:histidine kinase n=1 Tax=Alkalicoccus urumqiensis TaxID=1548213 RepID=A0A2P6MIY0_ALKUR|nr:ATP-binding protein [Alkalicoccus urumqiensis]PRO66227.1 two-component sensor histidine kinase [Alkalicoccus urumqiensis]
MTEILLANMLFLLLPVLAYLLFFEDRTSLSHNKWQLSLFTSLSILLCMTFPIQLELGFIFDLRYVPFLLLALVGGYTTALPAFIVMNLYRFYIGGDFVADAFFFSTIVYTIVPAFRPFFLKRLPAGRVITAGVISFTVMSIYLVTLLRFYSAVSWPFWEIALNVLLIHAGSTVVLMMLLEKIVYNIHARERLFQSERLHLISELSASVAHEIRNPLTVTSGFLQLLQQSDSINHSEKRYVDMSLQEVKRAEAIVTDFLSLAKPQAQHMVVSTLEPETEYVRNILLPFAHMHKLDIELTFTNNLTKRFDEQQMKQCLLNIGKNGLEAMTETGGTLYIRVFSERNWIVVEIEDSGAGMTKEEVQRIGKPYYSTKKEGTGLGMLMVFTTMDKLNGHVSIDSEPGRGTTVSLRMPAETEPSPQ